MEKKDNSLEFIRRAIQYLYVLAFHIQGLDSKLLFMGYLLRRFLYHMGFGLWVSEELKIKSKDMTICFSGKDAELAPYREIFLDKVYEKHHQFNMEKLIGNETIFDLGANIGLYTLKIAKNLREGKVYTFEPNPIVFQRLIKNIKENQLKNVEVFQFAIGSKCGKATMFLDGASPIGKISKDKGLENCIEVELVTLDHLVEKLGIPYIDILKMDVEGYEYEVLRGAVNSVSKIRKITMEYHGYELLEKVERLLRENGFEKTMQTDDQAFFINRDFELN